MIVSLAKRNAIIRGFGKFRQSFVTVDKEFYSKLQELSQLVLVQNTFIVGVDFITTIINSFI